MSKGSKQREEMKNILKEKLIIYQNEINKEPDIVIYDSINTTGSQKICHSDYFRHSVQMSTSPNKKHHQYDLYLNFPTFSQEFFNNRKSLTSQNIFAINKKAKAIKSSLNSMAKQKKSIENPFTPIRYLQKSTKNTPQKRSKSSQRYQKNQHIQNLNSFLTIGEKKSPKEQATTQQVRKSVTHQRSRTVKDTLGGQRPLSNKNRSVQNRSKSQYSSQKINPQIPVQLTEYYTPCYHKETNTGYIVKDFQPRLKVKHLDDNVKVMAKVIKKKILNLERQEIINYLKSIGSRRKFSQPDTKLTQTVRKTNFLQQKNILEQKIKRSKRIATSKCSFTNQI